jgi:Response regulator containing a CheY-like receiver domain and an HTH DNA-binding domain
MQQIVNKGELNIFDLFSCQEQEIAEYLLKYTSRQDVGNQLNLSYTTVATYRDRILKKANVKQISQLSKLIGHRHES